MLCVAGCAAGSARTPASSRTQGGVGAAPSEPGSSLWTLSDRGIKTDLILHMKQAPELLVIGGSRALRVDPAYIQRLTGLTAFNAAVPHATPEDEWCFANLLHSRFPTARFQLLWVIHCDELDQFSPGASLLEDPFLSRFLPARFVDRTIDAMGAAADASLAFDARQGSVVASNGFMVSDSISAAARHGTLRERVAGYVRATLRFYAYAPARIDSRPAQYFVQTLALMNRLGVAPTIVLAPVQPWYLAAVYGHGWEARHRLVLAYLRGLQRLYRFHVIDFSRVSSIGASATGFYDAVHLRPESARLLVRAAWRAWPPAFARPRALGT